MTREDRNELIATITKGVLTVILISLMGWIFLTWPDPTPPPHLVLDKEHILSLSKREMAEQTRLINEDMERRAKR